MPHHNGQVQLCPDKHSRCCKVSSFCHCIALTNVHLYKKVKMEAKRNRLGNEPQIPLRIWCNEDSLMSLGCEDQKVGCVRVMICCCDWILLMCGNSCLEIFFFSHFRLLTFSSSELLCICGIDDLCDQQLSVVRCNATRCAQQSNKFLFTDFLIFTTLCKRTRFTVKQL